MTEPRHLPRPDRTAQVVGAAFLLLAAVSRLRGSVHAPVLLAALGAFLVIAGCWMPRVALRFHTAWMGAAAVLGAVNTRILLAVVYYVLMTPLGIVLRLAGRDPLDRRGPARDSYWKPRNAARQAKEGFERLF